MYRLVVSGLSGPVNVQINGIYNRLIDLHIVDGIDCQDNFSEYFSGEYRNDRGEQDLIDKGVSGGHMSFFVDNGELMVKVVYRSKEKLTEEELETLVSYTQGQMSDGIGEGFEQFSCAQDMNGCEIFISPWFWGQKLTVAQKLMK